MNSVELSFRYHPGEYARAMRRVQARRLHVVRDVLVVVLVLAIGVYLWAIVGFGVWVGLLFGSVALFLAVLGFGVCTVPTLMERTQPKLREPYQLSFSDTGIHFRTTSIDSRLSWSLYTSWREDPDHLYLFHGKREFTVLPCRALAAEIHWTVVQIVLSKACTG